MRRQITSLFFVLGIALNCSAGLITIQPIRVTNTAGTIGPTVRLYEPETQKIFAQAGHQVAFLSIRTFMDDMFVSLDPNDFVDLTTGAGHQQNADSSVINMFFVNGIVAPPGQVIFGVGFLGGNGVAINATAVNAFNGGVGRLDTVAHEIGHNLNLDHDDFGAGGADNLMTAGASRSVPSSLADITPDGSSLSLLTAAQQTQIAASQFLTDATVPEPSTFVVYLVGACCCGGFMFRRRQEKAA